MASGDRAFIYHTGEEKRIVGIAEVAKDSYPDPSDKAWLAVDLKPVAELKRAVPLEEIKKNESLKHTALVRQGRLSVVPLTPAEARCVLKLGQSSL